METVILKIKRLLHSNELPGYATSGSAGIDLTAAISDPVTINPRERTRIPTGIIVEIPPGFEGQVRARSGLAYKAGIGLTNGVGTIDSDYRGEVMVLLINHGDKSYTVEPGEKVAQLVIVPIPQVQIIEVDELSLSHERGDGGFGSTGRLQDKTRAHHE